MENMIQVKFENDRPTVSVQDLHEFLFVGTEFRHWGGENNIMVKKENIELLTKGSMLAALYIITTAVNPFGYGMIQLRISAIISMLPFFRKEYRIPCIAAVAIANIFSPFGIIDVAAGILLWTLAYYIIGRLEDIRAICFMTAILSGAIIGGELSFMLKAPFLWNFVSISISQMIVFSIGAILWPRVLRA